MKELCLLLSLLLLCTTAALAKGGGGGHGGGGKSAMPGVVSEQLTEQGETAAQQPVTAQATQKSTSPGYFEVFAGFGMANPTIDKANLGINRGEKDFLVQTHNRWESFGRLAFGYLYFFGGEHNRYTKDWQWFPFIEPIFNIYSFEINPKGNVFLFGNRNLNNAKFGLPIDITSVMGEAALTLFTFKCFSLFVEGGAGAAWSDIKYHDKPRANALVRPALRLRTHDQSNGVFEWGGGVTFALPSKAALSVEYLYMHIGNIRTSHRGKLDGVPIVLISPPGFSLHLQTIMVNFHMGFS